MLIDAHLKKITRHEKQHIIITRTVLDLVDFVLDSGDTADTLVRPEGLLGALGPRPGHLLEPRVEVVHVQQPQLEEVTGGHQLEEGKGPGQEWPADHPVVRDPLQPHASFMCQSQQTAL